MRRTWTVGLALLLAASFATPAYAQFGGLGKKLRKKAEEETIGKVTDRHDKENKKLRDLLGDKVKYDARFANAQAALAEVKRLEEKKKATAETYFYLAKATLWYLERGNFEMHTARDQVAVAERGVQAVDQAEKKKFRFPPYAEERVKELKEKLLPGLNKQLAKWKGEAEVVARNEQIVAKLRADFKAEWDARETRDKQALSLLDQAEAKIKEGDTKKAQELLVAARASYLQAIKPTAESQRELLEKLSQGTGLRIAVAFVECFKKDGDGAGILREAELLENARTVLTFEEEEKIFLYQRLVRGRTDGFKRSHYVIDPSWEATDKKAKESRGVEAKRLLTNLEGYNPDSRNRMKVIEGIKGYRGQLVWWSEELTSEKKGVLTFDTTYTDIEYYACRETKKIKQITDDGRFIYEQKCKQRKVKRHRGNFVAKTVDPALPTLAKGWKVSVAGTIAKLKDKKTVQLDKAHVMWVKNPEGKLIWAYGVDVK